jgi:hypothetical protein
MSDKGIRRPDPKYKGTWLFNYENVSIAITREKTGTISLVIRQRPGTHHDISMEGWTAKPSGSWAAIKMLVQKEELTQ